jgi:hypothetical protein
MRLWLIMQNQIRSVKRLEPQVESQASKQAAGILKQVLLNLITHAKKLTASKAAKTRVEQGKTWSRCGVGIRALG